MAQNIIVAIIILAALAYTTWSVYQSVHPGKKQNNACGGCTGCDLKNMKNSCEHTSEPGKNGVRNKVFEQKFKS